MGRIHGSGVYKTSGVGICQGAFDLGHVVRTRVRHLSATIIPFLQSPRVISIATSCTGACGGGLRVPTSVLCSKGPHSHVTCLYNDDHVS